ncbi:hypothetical protein ACFU5O_35540 [Streptomyces sp. NPDC057445]|uniref:hypothetical protein n=1 Tax=Streptomyces sp. NPDC057445 TaxID=3346136 RepID=UPI0036AB5857
MGTDAPESTTPVPVPGRNRAFDFEGERVEINHQELDDLSLTWNTIDSSGSVR